MTDYRQRALAREVAEKLVDFDRRLSNVARKPQLANSSIENGALNEYTADGRLAAIIGRQFDGGHGVVVVSSPPPPTPTAPIVTPGLESATVRWDGIFAGPDGEPDIQIIAPTTFTRVEVHLSTEPDFAADTADTLRGTFESPRGGELVVSPLAAGTPVYARLVTRNSAGAKSPPSWAASATPLAQETQVLEEIDAAEVIIRNAGDALLEAEVGGGTVGGAINDAAASPVTDERLSEGSLTVWPFQDSTVPQGALAPGAVGEDDIADFAIAAKKINSTRHMLY